MHKHQEDWPYTGIRWAMTKFYMKYAELNKEYNGDILILSTENRFLKSCVWVETNLEQLNKNYSA